MSLCNVKLVSPDMAMALRRLGTVSLAQPKGFYDTPLGSAVLAVLQLSVQEVKHTVKLSGNVVALKRRSAS